MAQRTQSASRGSLLSLEEHPCGLLSSWFSRPARLTSLLEIISVEETSDHESSGPQ